MSTCNDGCTAPAEQQMAAYQLGRSNAATSVLIEICKRLLDLQLSLGKQQSQMHQVTGRTLWTCFSQFFDDSCSAPVMVRYDFKAWARQRYGDLQRLA